MRSDLIEYTEYIKNKLRTTMVHQMNPSDPTARMLSEEELQTMHESIHFVAPNLVEMAMHDYFREKSL